MQRAIGVFGIGCYTAFSNNLDVEVLQALHGRAPSLATGVKRAKPDTLVVTVQGDGDMVNEGLQEVLHAAARGENVTCFMLDNGVFGETGGHMTATTALGQRTKNTLDGRDAAAARLPDPPQQPHRRARRRRLRRAWRGEQRRQRRPDQEDDPCARSRPRRQGAGFSFVEILTMCPTGWFIETQEAPDYLTSTSGAGARARRAQGRPSDMPEPRTSAPSSSPTRGTSTTTLLAPLRERFPDLGDRRRSRTSGVSVTTSRTRTDELGDAERAVWARRRGDARARPARRTSANWRRVCAGSRRSAPGIDHLLEADLPGDVRRHQRRRRRRRARSPSSRSAGCSQVWKRFDLIDEQQRARDLEAGRSARWSKGPTLGVIGLGAIGSEVAVRARAFGMHTIGTRRSYRPGTTHPAVDELLGTDDLHDVLARCDAVVVSAPGTADTENLFDAGRVRGDEARRDLLQRRARARSSTKPRVDRRVGDRAPRCRDPRRHAATSRWPPTTRSWDAPNIYISPHCSTSQDRYTDKLLALFADNLGRYSPAASRCATSSTAPPGTDRRAPTMTFDVFDVHHHVGRAFDALGGELDAAAPTAEAFARFELAERLRIMDEGGVRQALVIPGHGYLRPNGIADTPAGQRRDRRVSRRHARPLPGGVRHRRTARRRGRVRRDRPRRRRARPGRAELPHPLPGRLDGQPVDPPLPRADGRARRCVPIIHAMDDTPGGGALEAGVDRTASSPTSRSSRSTRSAASRPRGSASSSPRSRRTSSSTPA